MTASFIITLRETLEAALIVGIVIGVLKRSNQSIYYRMVWYGVLAGVALSVLGAALFQRLAGGFSGRAEELFEGITMLVGGFLITTLIVWIIHRGNFNQELSNKTNEHVYQARPLSIFFMVLVAILREGIETVIFLQSASLVSGDKNLWGALLGIVLATGLGVALYFGFLRINLKKFFYTTSIILVFFAAGLIAHGVHEFQEVGVLPILTAEVWDINPTVLVDGSYPLWHEKGIGGHFLVGLLGYNGNPTGLEVIVYIFYMVVIVCLWNKISRKKAII